MARPRAFPFWSRSVALADTTPASVFLPNGWGVVEVTSDVDLYVGLGNAYAAPAVASVSGVTTISSRGSPSAGTFVVGAYGGWGTTLTGAIAFDATAATIKTAMVATGLFATGDITAAGGALPADVTLTWTGVYAGTVPRLYTDSTLITGGSISANITTQPKGNGGYVYVVAGGETEVSTDPSGSGGGSFLYLASAADVGTAYVTAYR